MTSRIDVSAEMRIIRYTMYRGIFFQNELYRVTLYEKNAFGNRLLYDVYYVRKLKVKIINSYAPPAYVCIKLWYVHIILFTGFENLMQRSDVFPLQFRVNTLLL